MLTLKIKTDNAAFTDQDRSRGSVKQSKLYDQLAQQAECARILRQAAEIIERNGVSSGSLYDSNGNIVGSFNLNNR